MKSYLLFEDFPELETETLRLRQINQFDVEAIFKLFSDEDVIKYHDVTAFKNIARAKGLINRWGERFKSIEGIRWGIVKKTDDAIIGTCGLSQWNKGYFRAEVGYELGKQYWRQGIMTEALKAMIKFGFEKMELNRIEATVMLGNTASMKLLEKVGFIEECTLRNYGFWKNEFHDLKMFSILKSDYTS